MEKISFASAADYSLDKVLSLKKNKKIFVIFSTFGEREADLIYDKISLIRSATESFVDKIFVSHRREDKDKEDITEKKAKNADKEAEILLCNFLDVPDMSDEKGKGADMRRALYAINISFIGDSNPEDIVAVFLDSDVVAEYFGEHFVLGLAGAVLNGADFAKASFWREMGRVKKYVAQPLFSLIDHPVLSEMTKLAYPLSGEVAGSLEFFNSVNFWQIYGVETGINLDACFGSFKITDVNLGLYDHEHHPDLNIQKMSFGIIRTYLLKLIQYGIIELKDGAKVSDIFKASLISEKKDRECLDIDLTEIMYEPLKNIL
ncbi:MAG: hypothetical protein JW864_07375 [Spirochaetes bacterium]|nr:hypothetical protein [Spirochaetota bacterium]